MSEVKLPEIGKVRGASRGAASNTGDMSGGGMVKRQNSLGGAAKSKFMAKKERQE